MGATCTDTHTHLCTLACQRWCLYLSSNRSLCAPNLTCFEPEAHGHMLTGMDFHKLYMENSQREFASVCACVCVCIPTLFYMVNLQSLWFSSSC